jgi:hypothetical protein
MTVNPDGVDIVSHNLGGLYSHATAATYSGACIYAWHETEVGQELLREHRGKLTELGYSIHMAKHADAEDDNHSILSRAAIATRGQLKGYALKITDDETLALAESGRWTERLIPVRDGMSFIIVASLYGHSGASWDPALARRNDRLIKAAVLRAAQFLSTPYFLCCDLNQNPDTSLTIRTALDTGILSDLAADWAEDHAALAPTFRKEGVYKGMSGPGTTRIDVVLANNIGSAVVQSVETVWDKAILFDHTPIRVRLSISAMTQKVWRAGRPIGIEVDKVIFGTAGKKPEEKRKLQHEAAQSFQRIWGLYKPAFENALESGNIDEAHRIWCLGCELWLYLAQNCDDEGEGGSPSIERFLMRGVPRRGTTMPVREEKLVPDVEDGKDTAVLAVNKKLLQAIASAKGILLHIKKAGVNKDGLPDGKTTELVQKLVLMVIKVVAAEKTQEK